MSCRIFSSDFRRLLRKYTKSILATVLIFYLSLVPSSGFDGFKEFVLFEGIDKLIHFLMYFILSLFLLVEYGNVQSQKYFNLQRFIIAFLYPALLGTIMEFCQYLFTPSRFLEIADLMFNLGGVFSAWLICTLIGFKTIFLKKTNEFSRRIKI